MNENDDALAINPVAAETSGLPIYTDYWLEFGRHNMDVEDKTAIRHKLVGRYREQLLGRHQVVSRHPSATLAYEAQHFYRMLGQHNQLEGAEEDLEAAADIILAPYYRGERVSDDLLLEAGSMLLDLSRATPDREKQADYRTLAKDSLQKLVEDENLGWSDQIKLNAAMLRRDVEFDQIFELYWQSGAIAEGKVQDHNKYAAINNFFAQQQTLSINQFQQAWQGYTIMPEGSRQEVKEKTQALGQILEWAYIIDQRTQSYDAEECELSRVRHATLRQDAGHDGYSGQLGYLSDNFDVSIESFNKYGESTGMRKIQLSLAGHDTIQYREPIREYMLDESLNMNAVYEAIRSEGRMYLPADSPAVFNGEDKSRVKRFRQGLVAVH